MLRLCSHCRGGQRSTGLKLISSERNGRLDLPRFQPQPVKQPSPSSAPVDRAAPTSPGSSRLTTHGGNIGWNPSRSRRKRITPPIGSCTECARPTQLPQQDWIVHGLSSFEPGRSSLPDFRFRHRSEQYFTASQFFSHFFRQVKASPQTGQIFVGRLDFRVCFGIGFTRHSDQGKARGIRPRLLHYCSHSKSCLD